MASEDASGPRLVEAPEFVEGWGMYCEQMMLEEGFEDTPERRVIVATDAIWRAARIVLDIRLHRGEIGVDDGVAFLVEHTGFEPPVARAEAIWESCPMISPANTSFNPVSWAAAPGMRIPAGKRRTWPPSGKARKT